MPRHTCDCGARFRFPESAIGKRSKCKQCGTIFTLVDDEAGVIPVADDIGASPDAAQDAVADPPSPVQGRIFVPTSLSTSTPSVVQSVKQGTGDTFKPSFSTDVLWTFLFPTSPGNLITLLVIWGALWLAPFAPFVFGMLMQVCLGIWYAAFQFAVLESAAAGERELPNVTFTRDLFDDLILPMWNWAASWVVVLLPAIVYLLLARSQGWITGPLWFSFDLGGIGDLPQGMLIFYVLVLFGLFFWPMVILCVALGGWTTIYRVDLIAQTIVRTFPAYSMTLLLMFAGVFVEYAIRSVFATASLGGAVSMGLDVYFDIVLMRLIGLYYHHFKDRFAWSWE